MLKAMSLIAVRIVAFASALLLGFSAIAAAPEIGRWRLALDDGKSTSDLIIEPDGQFYFVIVAKGNPDIVTQWGGTYTLADGILELRQYGDPKRAMKFRCSVAGETLDLSGLTSTAKQAYKRIPDPAALATQPVPKAAAKTPSDAAIRYYTALNNSPQSEIDKLRSAASIANEKKLPAEILKSRNDNTLVTGGHTLARVEVLKENLQGERAWVDVRLHYASGSSQKYNIGFIKEDGDWKVTDD